MFYGCSSLKKLNLSHFNTMNIHSMSHMFDYCKSLKTLDISNFTINNFMDFNFMFEDCSFLEEVYLPAEIQKMFPGCSNNPKINFKNQKSK